MLELVDDELCILDPNTGEITHVFERSDLPLTTYNYMTKFVEKNFNDEINPEEVWRLAGIEWENLSIQNKTYLWSITQQEYKNAQDIGEGLLATLNGYQGFPRIKNEFRDALIQVRNKFKS